MVERLRFLQLNCGRGRLVMDEARQLAAVWGIDVLLLQEPYSRRAKLAGLPRRARVVSTGDSPMAAIVVLNPRVEVTRMSQLCTSHTAAATLAWGRGREVLAISQYYQFSDEIGPYERQLEKALSLVGHRFVIGADVNAKSGLWGSPFTDPRGRDMEDLLAGHDLVVLNDGAQGPTCQIRAEAGSFVDVTLMSPSLARYCTGWTLHPAATSSDHNPVTFVLEPDGAPSPSPRGFVGL